MDTLPGRTEVILSQSHTSLGYYEFEFQSQPGAYLEIEGRFYQVLERRHRYQFRGGRYQLQHVALLVQPSKLPDERHWLNGHWVIGDPTCTYNALSPVLRCAVNPAGPCDRCTHYQPAQS